MWGIIYKPTTCCNNSTSLGKHVFALGKVKPGKSTCRFCGLRDRPITEDHVEISGKVPEGYRDSIIESSRVKWYDDSEPEQRLEVEDLPEDSVKSFETL